MSRTQADEQFTRFRSTGDPGALAEVFDRTAPELLRVAHHLVRDVHAAEEMLFQLYDDRGLRLITIEKALLPGRYRIVCEHEDDGVRGEVEVEIPSGGRTDPLPLVAR